MTKTFDLGGLLADLDSSFRQVALRLNQITRGGSADLRANLLRDQVEWFGKLALLQVSVTTPTQAGHSLAAIRRWHDQLQGMTAEAIRHERDQLLEFMRSAVYAVATRVLNVVLTPLRVGDRICAAVEYTPVQDGPGGSEILVSVTRNGVQIWRPHHKNETWCWEYSSCEGLSTFTSDHIVGQLAQAHRVQVEILEKRHDVDECTAIVRRADLPFEWLLARARPQAE